MNVLKKIKLSTTFEKVIDEYAEKKYAKGDLSITFRIGKDDITRKINTCLLALEMVKTNMQEMNLIQRYWQGINLVQRVSEDRTKGYDQTRL